MTETLHQSSDVPNFDTYPSPYPSNHPEAHSGSDGPDAPALAQRARQIGEALGTAVSILRKAREQMRELGSQTTESAVTHLNDLAETAKAKAHDLRQATATRIRELRETAAQKAEELGERTKAGYYQARHRASRISREHPEYVIVAACVLGILLGMGIRKWRANRAY
ncbi:MAG TPA: hypothetical protein VNV88_15265 [Candidatus Solibacter sp.]|jgi:ElaB/YqjD/DUF883 family membrane-anchored ribosome-binding protein|nr:hypothetical protein [Candidatus Solibacter sp.]